MSLRNLLIVCGSILLLPIAAGAARADATVYEVQLGVYPTFTMVECRGVVVTAVGRFGFFVQEPNPDPTWGRQYSGVWVFTNSLPGVRKGDLVDVTARYEEYFNFSELNATISGSSILVVGQRAVPDPVLVTIAEVNDTGAFNEAYEGVLIRVDREDPTLYAYPLDQYNEWYLRTESNGSGDSLLVDQYSAAEDFEYDVPDPGTELSFAAGILVYNFSQYKLAPRNCETDLGAPCKPVLRGACATGAASIRVQFGVPLDEASAENIANYELASGYAILGATLDPEDPRVVHLTTEELFPGDPEQIIVNNVLSEGGLAGDPNQVYEFRSGITPIYQIQYVSNPGGSDASPLLDEIVTVQGVVTAVETNGNYYYLQDGDGGAWRGLYSRVAASVPVRVGDEIQVSGRIAEYFGATQLNFQSGILNFQNFGPAADPVVVNTVTASQIPFRGTARAAEPWEYNLVKIEAATLVDTIPGVPNSPYFDEWLLRQDAQSDTAGMDLSEVSYDACPGNVVDATGILRYAFSQFRIYPRTGINGDIQEIFAVPGCPTTDVAAELRSARVRLEQNRPNPFGEDTTIRFALPSPGRVSLEVIDVAGRLVRTIASGELAAGEHALRWDGLNASGQPVGAGTYFTRLRADGLELSRKMIRLE